MADKIAHPSSKRSHYNLRSSGEDEGPRKRLRSSNADAVKSTKVRKDISLSLYKLTLYTYSYLMSRIWQANISRGFKFAILRRQNKRRALNFTYIGNVTLHIGAPDNRGEFTHTFIYAIARDAVRFYILFPVPHMLLMIFLGQLS